MKEVLRSAAVLAAVFCSGFSSIVEAQTSAAESDDEELEEIIVAATRIEGGGGGRGDASRQQLDDSDEIDMEGFFDELDGVSTLGGDGEVEREPQVSTRGFFRKFPAVVVDDSPLELRFN